MRTFLAVVADGTATSVLECALLAARQFDGCIVGLNALTTEYAVVFGGEMGFSVSSEVNRRSSAKVRSGGPGACGYSTPSCAHGVPIALGAGPNGPSAEWREESGGQNAVVGALRRIFDLIVVERPAKLASLAEATLEDALFESGRPVLMAPPMAAATIGERFASRGTAAPRRPAPWRFARPYLERATACRCCQPKARCGRGRRATNSPRCCGGAG